MVQYNVKQSRLYRFDGQLHFWVKDKPEDVDLDGYFNPVGLQFDSPDEKQMPRRGVKFTVVCEETAGFHRAEFVFIGFRKRVVAEATTDTPARYQITPCVKRVTDWGYFSINEPAAKPEQVAVEKYVPGDAKVKWNPGKKKHQVILDDKVLYETGDLQDAKNVASGAKPLAA